MRKISRRDFMIAGTAAACGAVLFSRLRFFGRGATERARTGGVRYPGPVIVLRPGDIIKPGRWAG